MASLPKKYYALVIEFFDPSNMNWAIQYLLRVYQHLNDPFCRHQKGPRFTRIKDKGKK